MSGTIAGGTNFTRVGTALGGDVPAWAASGNRWAPENIEFDSDGKTANAMFFSDTQRADSKHRVGWAERVFFSISRSKPTANTEDPCRSEGT